MTAAGRRATCDAAQRTAPISLTDAFNPWIARDARARATADFLVAAVAAIVLIAVASFSPRVFIDGDTNWHVAAGRWILQHRLVPHTDPFSYTYAGKPWVAHEWGSEVLMTLAYYAAGWSGVVLLIGAAAGLAYAMIAAELRLWMGPFGQLVGLGLSFACLQPFLFARPHIVALPVMVFWTRCMLAARREQRAPPLALAPLMLLWANLHASFIFGFAVAAPFGLEALIAEKNKARVLLGWGLFGALSLACALITPNGIEGIVFPFMVMGMKVLPNILEWRAQTFQQPTLFEASLLITLFIGLWRGVRVPPLRLLLVVGLVHMALQHVRQQAVLAALAPLLLAEPFGRSLKTTPAEIRLNPRIGWPDLRRWLPVPLALALLGVGAVAALRLASPVVRRDNGNVPVSAMAHVPPDIARLPVFNEYAFGGYLIFKGVHPYIDGRADMYGDDWVREYLAIIGAQQPDVDQAFKRWNIRWTILSPRDKLVGLLDRTPGWRRLYADRWAVVQVKDAPTPQTPTGAAP